MSATVVKIGADLVVGDVMVVDGEHYEIARFSDLPHVDRVAYSGGPQREADDAYVMGISPNCEYEVVA